MKILFFSKLCQINVCCIAYAYIFLKERIRVKCTKTSLNLSLFDQHKMSVIFNYAMCCMDVLPTNYCVELYVQNIVRIHV